jgi:hypothetical protein
MLPQHYVFFCHILRNFKTWYSPYLYHHILHDHTSSNIVCQDFLKMKYFPLSKHVIFLREDEDWNFFSKDTSWIDVSVS